jgi:hypothetical protein
MALNSQKYRDALANLGPKPASFTAPPAAFHDWLVERQLPNDLADFLQANALGAHVPFPSGCGGMWTPQDIMVLNDQEAAIFAAGLFAVGNATNGDFIVIDLRDERRPAGFVSHDELWGRPSDDVRAFFILVAESLDEMLTGMSGALWECLRGEKRELRYPTDYCDALSWSEKK